MLLLEQAANSDASETDAISAKRWIKKMSSFKKSLTERDPVDSTNSYDLVFDGYVTPSNSSSKQNVLFYSARGSKL